MGRLPEGRQEAACKKDLKLCPFLHSMVQSNIIEWCKRIKKPVLSRLPATKKLFIFCEIFGVGESKKAFPYFGIFGEVRPAEKAPGFLAQFYAGNPPTFTVYIIPRRWGAAGKTSRPAQGFACGSPGRPQGIRRGSTEAGRSHSLRKRSRQDTGAPATDQTGRPAKRAALWTSPEARQAQPGRKALERIGEAQAGGETPAAGALFVRIVRNCMKRRTFQQENRPRI